MNEPAQATHTAHQLATKVDEQLSESLRALEKSLSRVERDLHLGCENLHDLVNSQNPDVRKQLDYLQEGLSELHANLAGARSSIASARGDTVQLKDALPEPESTGDSSGDDAPKLDQKVSAKMRHDEPVTLGGILRALLMADAPEQRR